MKSLKLLTLFSVFSLFYSVQQTFACDSLAGLLQAKRSNTDAIDIEKWPDGSNSLNEVLVYIKDELGIDSSKAFVDDLLRQISDNGEALVSFVFEDTSERGVRLNSEKLMSETLVSANIHKDNRLKERISLSGPKRYLVGSRAQSIEVVRNRNTLVPFDQVIMLRVYSVEDIRNVLLLFLPRYVLDFDNVTRRSHDLTEVRISNRVPEFEFRHSGETTNFMLFQRYFALRDQFPGQDSYLEIDYFEGDSFHSDRLRRTLVISTKAEFEEFVKTLRSDQSKVNKILSIRFYP